MEEFNTEELKTAIGYLMLDLRGNWAFDYIKRMELVIDALKRLLINDPENAQYKNDLEVTKSEISDPCDGRIFRDSCDLYGYSSEEGKTDKVWDFLQKNLTYPDSNNFDKNSSNALQQNENK